MASEDIGQVYKTQIPGYDDAADIQAALKLYHYGTTTAPSTEADVVPNSVAGHLKSIDNRVDVLEVKRTAGDVLDAEPTGIPDGYIWLDKTTTGNGAPIYATAIVSTTAPTQGLVDGLIWVNINVEPVRTFVYQASEATWTPLTEIPGIIDAAGDLIYGSANNDIERLPIGINGQVLKVVSGLPAWASENGVWTQQISTSLSGSTMNLTSLSGSKLYLILKNWSHSDISMNKAIAIQFNSDTGASYIPTSGHTTQTFISTPSVNNTGTYTYGIMIDMADTSIGLKPISSISSSDNFGYYTGVNPITSIQLTLSSGTFDSGTVEVWSYA